MKYIRTKDGRIIPYKKEYDGFTKTIGERFYYINQDDVITFVHKDMILKQADTIEELIQIGDIVFYWAPSDDKEHCVVINYDIELDSIKYNVITKLLIPVGEDYKCVAKGYPSFNLINNKRYLANKGELKLL